MTKVNTDRVKELWEKGLNDVEIGERLGCSKSTVFYHRKKKLNLPSNTWIDRERVRELNSKGLNDSEIGERLGCSNTSVWRIRKELDIPPTTRITRPEFEMVVTQDGVDGDPVTSLNGWTPLIKHKDGHKRILVYGKRGKKIIKIQILRINEGEIWIRGTGKYGRWVWGSSAKDVVNMFKGLSSIKQIRHKAEEEYGLEVLEVNNVTDG